MEETIKHIMLEMGVAAKSAAVEMNKASTEQKNLALQAIAGEILARRSDLMLENEKDLEAARANGISDALLDRLTFTEARFNSMVEGLEQVATLNDPVGEITDMSYRPTGIQVGKMRVPLGVIGIIYESRPNVTIDAASLCLKSGNATICVVGLSVFIRIADWRNVFKPVCLQPVCRKQPCRLSQQQIVPRWVS